MTKEQKKEYMKEYRSGESYKEYRALYVRANKDKISQYNKKYGDRKKEENKKEFENNVLSTIKNKNDTILNAHLCPAI